MNMNLQLWLMSKLTNVKNRGLNFNLLFKYNSFLKFYKAVLTRCTLVQLTDISVHEWTH